MQFIIPILFKIIKISIENLKKTCEKNPDEITEINKLTLNDKKDFKLKISPFHKLILLDIKDIPIIGIEDDPCIEILEINENITEILIDYANALKKFFFLDENALSFYLRYLIIEEKYFIRKHLNNYYYYSKI